MIYYLNEIKLFSIHYGLWYLAAISVIAAIVTIFDKISAKSHGRRVPEKTLLILAALGGSTVMYAVMHLIRHKTRHLKFMIGIPVIIAVQAVLIVVLYIEK